MSLEQQEKNVAIREGDKGYIDDNGHVLFYNLGNE